MNAGEDKLDFFARRDVRYEVFLNPDGSATAEIAVTLRNEAPAGLPPEVTGGSFRSFDPNPGDAITVLSVFCGPCEVASSVRDNEDFLTVSREEELGHTVLETWEPVPQGEARTTTHVVRIPDLWRPDADEVDAVLRFQEQVQINPTRLEVVVHPPAGWELLPARDDVVVEDGVATWSGTPRPLEELGFDLRGIPAPEPPPTLLDRLGDLLP